MSDERANKSSREDVFSKAVRAGKRTYFFDVKATRGNDLYITITESKKRFSEDGSHFYEKHKLFLYKEDFEKFIEGLQQTIEEIDSLKDHQPEVTGNGRYAEDQEEAQQIHQYAENTGKSSFTDLSFEDLDA
jgi:hypothetical protein